MKNKKHNRIYLTIHRQKSVPKTTLSDNSNFNKAPVRERQRKRAGCQTDRQSGRQADRQIQREGERRGGGGGRGGIETQREGEKERERENEGDRITLLTSQYILRLYAIDQSGEYTV